MRLEWEAAFDAGHPAFAGHFPGHPVVPGVLLLDGVVQRIEAAGGAALGDANGQRTVCEIAAAKFLRPVAPGETLVFACEWDTSGSGRFHVDGGSGRVAEGRMSLTVNALVEKAAL